MLTDIQRHSGLIFKLPGHQEFGARYGGKEAFEKAIEIQEAGCDTGQQYQQPYREKSGQREGRLEENQARNELVAPEGWIPETLKTETIQDRLRVPVGGWAPSLFPSPSDFSHIWLRSSQLRTMAVYWPIYVLAAPLAFLWVWY